MARGWVVTRKQDEQFRIRLKEHISNVREAGRAIGVPDEQLNCHDDSKWGRNEFPYYATNFIQDDMSPLSEEEVKDGFAVAWMHHIHHNQHHWQHWLFPDGYSPRGSTVEDGAIFMPGNYVREMVADWMGASKTYTGSWDMTEWLGNNLDKIKIHSRSREILHSVLSGLGYSGY